MKAIGIKMVDLQPMDIMSAQAKGYRTPREYNSAEGYEVTYTDGYKSWYPKEVADKVYFKLNKENDGSIIQREDVDNFIKMDKSETISDKTAFVHAHTITGVDYFETHSYVDSKNYNSEFATQCAMNKVINKVWDSLDFILQWARNGLINISYDRTGMVRK